MPAAPAGKEITLQFLTAQWCWPTAPKILVQANFYIPQADFYLENILSVG